MTSETAYIGVDGARYRNLVPVRRILLHRVEGPTELCRPMEQFTNWHDANWQLMVNAKTAPAGGGYDRHDFTVEFADGFTYRGRFYLERCMTWPRLEDHVREHLQFLARDPRVEEIFRGRTLRQTRENATFALETYDLRQGPVPAPDWWFVVRDYRTHNAA